MFFIKVDSMQFSEFKFTPINSIQYIINEKISNKKGVFWDALVLMEKMMMIDRNNASLTLGGVSNIVL